MWVPDIPIQTIEPSAIYLAANTITARAPRGAVAPHKLGVCSVINEPFDIAPTFYAEEYLAHYMSKEFKFDFSPDGGSQIDNSAKNFNFENYPDGSVRADTRVRIIEQPKHGRLVQAHPDATDYEKYHYKYIPDVDFADFDHFVVEILGGGITVQIYYTMSVSLPREPTYIMDENGQKTDDLSRCSNPYWKISIAPNATPANQAYALSLPAAMTGNDYISPTFTFTNLLGAAVGETQGEGAATITLDTNTAGPRLAHRFSPVPERRIPDHQQPMNRALKQVAVSLAINTN
ncbi:MAG: hypothetical protein Q7T96_18100 [Methylobacter sp.]|nr:hypothetical protein [Methylobacter sp.]